MKNAHRISSFALAIALAACGSSTETTPPPTGPQTNAGTEPAPAAPAAVTPPTLRLPSGQAPTSYHATLVLDPAKTDFTGHIEIAMTFEKPTPLFWLNGRGLTVDSATLTPSSGSAVALEVLPGGDEFIGFRAPAPIAAGAATLAIDYHGKIDAVDTYGIFHQQDHGNWYAYTQFESIGARRAFPCFDEPDYKVPWQVTLEVPTGQVAVSNTPVESQTPTDHGTVAVRFRQTKPLPSYLVAFGVGPFDFVDGGKTKNGVPVRIITMKGRAGEAAWAAKSTAHIIDLLQDYFGIPYPYAKADALAVPMTVGFGAMENPGLITYTEGLILAKPADESEGSRRRYAWVAAHELAHQWFGDLVTPVWWNDIWLNEAFATWMEQRIMERFQPAWDAPAHSVLDMQKAMSSDSLDSARRITQPIVTKDDIEGAFDPITYEKGAAVIRMFEHWVGPETFRKGVHDYLEKHAWKNATSAEFLDAIGVAAGKDVKTPFSTFLDQVGTPQVSMKLTCEKGKPAALSLAHQRYLPLGSKASADVTWQVPVCVKYPAGKSVATACTLLTAKSGALALDKAKGCPAWVAPNADAIGYYRSQLPDAMLKALDRHGLRKLSLVEKLSLVGDVRAMVADGSLPIGNELDLAAGIGRDKSRFLVGQAAGVVEGLDDEITPPSEPGYAAFIRGVFGKRARKLGWKPRPKESLDDSEVRLSIVPLVAEQGRDKKLSAEAVKLAKTWLTDRTAVAPRLRGAVLRVAARSGDAKLFDAFLAEAKKTDSRRDRRALLGALGAFRDPALTQRALALLLTDDFDIREASSVMWGALSVPDQRKQVLEFVDQHFDALIAKMPKEGGARLGWIVPSQCDASVRPQVVKLLDRVAKLPSGPRTAKQALERFDLCVDRRQAQAKAIADYFAKH